MNYSVKDILGIFGSAILSVVSAYWLYREGGIEPIITLFIAMGSLISFSLNFFLSSKVFEGSVKGTVCWPPKGNMGFGYDPFFMPSGYNKTFGEVNQDWKHSISHRSIAFAKFLNYVDDA